MLQTVINLTLGYPALILPNKPLWSQIEYAQQMNPSMALVELGYYEALDAATNNDPSRLPDAGAFKANYSTIAGLLRKYSAEVIVTTIPNPFDTGYFTAVSGLSRLVPADNATIARVYGLKPDDLVTANAVTLMANQIRWNEQPSLPPNSIISGATQASITASIGALNSAINSVAQSTGAVVYDLNGLFHRVRTSGLLAGSYPLTADYLGGFYSLDGFYPGWTGSALIANELLNLLNQTYGTAYPVVSLADIVQNDPAVRHSLNFSQIIPPVQP